MTPANSVWSLAMTAVFLGCAGASPCEASAAKTATSTPAVVFAAGAPCVDEPDIVDEACRSADALEENLKKLGFSGVTVVRNPSRDDVLAWVRSAGSTPMLVAYTGHATLIDQEDRVQTECPHCQAECRSALCLGNDEKLPLDEMMRAVPPTATFVTFMVDACSSGHVDVRLARAPVSVLSASPHSTKVSIKGLTPFSGALEMFPKNVDIDCDSRLSDWELFRGFTRSMRADEFASPHPKLRRHVREETPPLVASPGSSCWPHKKDRKQTFPDVIEPYSCGASHRLRVEGFVEPEGTLMIGGATERASELVAVPCEHDSGQCFRRKSDPVCQSDPTGGRCETW